MATVGEAEAPRVVVEVDIFSGAPNPRWTLDADSAARLATFVSQLTRAPDGTAPSDPGLGFRGFVVRGLDSGSLGATTGAEAALHVRGDDVVATAGDQQELYTDSNHAIYTMLRDLARDHVPSDIASRIPAAGTKTEHVDDVKSMGVAAKSQVGSAIMDMLRGDKIAEANLTDWRKLAQGLHARYLVDDFGAGARFVTAVGEAGDALGHHPSVSIGTGYVDLKLISDDAIYRDDEGTEHVVAWVTQEDVDLARRITEIAADHKIDADPASVSMVELGLDTARSATIAPVWAAILTGNAEAQGHGSPSDEVRDATGRVPNLWFGDADEHEPPRQRFHVEVYLAPEAAQERIEAAVAAGGTIVDDSDTPALTVIADQDGNTGVVCVDMSAAKKD